MTLVEALEFSHKLAAGDYTRNQLDQLLDYLHTADRRELEAFFHTYNDAIHELPEPGPVNPEFMDRLYTLYPGKDADRDKTSDDNDPAGAPDYPADDRPVARIRVRTLILGIAATVIIALLSIWTWKATLSHPQPAPMRAALGEQSGQIIPGGNKAVLTLANGHQILLDSLQNGAIPTQGNTQVLKQTSGRLAYQPGHTQNSTTVYNTITTPKGGQYQVVLPDGSRVWLNAASSLRFPTAFTGNERQVEMTGEVYFEIARNQEMPFTVRSNNFQVQVLGTHFNVNAYDDESWFKTTLLEGSVNVQDVSGSSLLKPGEQAVAASAGGNIRVIREADTEAAVAWKNGRFEFNNADIPTIMRQIARWYNVDISYEGNIPPDHFTGEVARSSSLTKVLQIFSLSQIHFRIEGKKIIVVS